MLLLLASQAITPTSGAAPPPIATVALPSPGKPPVSAVLEQYRLQTDALAGRRCGGVGPRGDIIVCRADQAARLPLPDERITDESAFHDASSRGALANMQRPCPPTGCTGVNLFAIPFKVFRIARALLDPDR